MNATDPIVRRVDVSLGSIGIPHPDDVADNEPDPFIYLELDVVAGYLVTLSPLALEVTERKLTALKLVVTDYDNDGSTTELTLPADVEQLGAFATQLGQLLGSVCDYLAQEAGA